MQKKSTNLLKIKNITKKTKAKKGEEQFYLTVSHKGLYG